MDLRVCTNDGVRSGVSVGLDGRQVVKIILVNRSFAQATGLLVQALERIVAVVVTMGSPLLMTFGASAHADTSDVLLVGSDTGIGHGVVGNKGCHTITYSERVRSFGVEGTATAAACEDRSILANVLHVAGAAGQMAGVMTLFFARARKNLILVDKELESILVALDLVGNHLVDLMESIDRDDRGTRREGQRSDVGGIGYIGKDPIILLENDSGKGMSRSLQEEDGEDDECSEDLPGGNLSVLGAGWSVKGFVCEAEWWTGRKGQTYCHDHRGRDDLFERGE